MLASLHSLLRAHAPEDILRVLADAALSAIGAQGVAIVEVLPGGEARVIESRNVPESVRGWRAEVEVIDSELGARLLAASGGRFTQARTLPMMSGGDLFGALVIFSDDPVGEGASSPTSLGGERLMRGEALVDVASTSLGKARQFQALSRSYAELRASREVLERTQKLRALGEMAAGISHDLKNILNPLSLHLQLLKRTLKRGGQGAEEAIVEMEQVLRRGVETLDRLREFSRQAPESRIEIVELDVLAHEAVELARPRVASLRRANGVRIVEELGHAPPIRARSAELVAAVLNLVVNSIDAMIDGGTITVATGAADDGAFVRVADDGPGIPEELVERVFEPFFTTKGRDGTGLGLAMVYAFVQRHGGKLNLDTAPGRGTTFTLWFPRPDRE